MLSRRRLLLVAAVVVLTAGAALEVWYWRAVRVETPAPSVPEATPTATGPAEPPAPQELAQTVQIKRGDTLVTALARAGLEARRGQEVASAMVKAGADLRRLKPGDGVEITWSPASEPMAVTWQSSPWLGYAAVLGEDGWTVTRLETTPDVRVEAVEGSVQTSLFQAVEDVGESPPLVIALVNIFETEFDFTADTRAGDRFRLLVEKHYAGDSFVNYGRIVAAQYEGGRRRLTGIAFPAGKERVAYYDLEGRSLRKSFLRSPLEFTRVTSGFTYARPHPILGGTLPHLAVDYAAPNGTPVRAVADGVVSHAGWDGGYGLAVRIRHRSGYETLYAHLSRLGASTRPGTRVSQRQVIAYTGSTGMSTGPHLHYEVVKGGRRVNPLSEKFIPGEPIAGGQRAEFSQRARELIARLEDEAPF